VSTIGPTKDIPDAQRAGGHAVPMLDPRWVSLRADRPGGTDNDLWVALRLGDPPKVTGGGGVETVERVERRPMTVWQGGEAVTMELNNLLLDGYRERRSVEDAIRTLEKMAGALVSGKPGAERPDALIVQGIAVPHDYLKSSGSRWMIAEPPDWTEPVIRAREGFRLRQAVNLKLLLVEEPDRLDRVDARDPAPNYRVHVATGSETFTQIAHKELKNARLGGELAKLNRELNPAFKGQHPNANTKPKKGVKVRLPSKKLQAEWERDRRNRPKG
jgi:hypothetical protein